MVKRILEIMISGTVLVLGFLPLAVISILLKMTGEREVFFFQERMGKSGKVIYISKFVTMVKESPEIGTRDITIKNDPRVLPVGRFLRKSKLNEFPQFWDVFVGKLALVGWRPLMPKGFANYPKEVQQKLLTIKPGLTGLGSLFFRNEEAIVAIAQKQGLDLPCVYRNDIMPFKGALECWYVDNQSLWVDTKIVIATAFAVLRPNWKGYRNWFHGLPVPESSLIKEQFNGVVGSGQTAVSGTPS